MDSAVVLGLAANVVAICAVIVGWRQNRDTLENQRHLADLGHVRGLLDDAAVALHRAAQVLDEVEREVIGHGLDFFKSPKGSETFATLDGCRTDLGALSESLRVRFGRKHEVVTALAQAAWAVDNTYESAALVRIEPDVEGSHVAEEARREMHEELSRMLTTYRERFDRARDDFIDAAHSVAGAELPTS